MAASGNSIALKSFQSFAINEGLLAKVVEAVKAGEKEARTSGDIKSFEVFYKGFRQNIAIGRIFIVPVKVCNNFKEFPIALLYGTVVRELNLGEEVADLIEKKIGETEFDEYSQIDIQGIKDKLFKDEDSDEYRSLILFAPNWSNVRDYVVFKFTGDDTKLANLVRHQIFSAYFNPALSGAFDALMTNVDTSKLDVTDVTPKLTYPFITENPLKQYPDLQKTGNWNKPKVFLTVKTADAITQDVLDPQELSVFEDLDKALTEAALPETTEPEELGFEAPESISGTVEIPEVGAEAEIKTSAEGDGTELRHRPDYGEKGSFTQKMNEENAKLGTAKLGAKFDRNATNCKDCGQLLNAFGFCNNVSSQDAANGQQFCGKGLQVPDYYVGGGSGSGQRQPSPAPQSDIYRAPRKDVQPEVPGRQRQFGSDKTAAPFDHAATTCADCGKPLDALKMCPDAPPNRQFCGNAKNPSPYVGDLRESFFNSPKKDIQREVPGRKSLFGAEKQADTADNPASEKGGEGVIFPKTDKEKPVTASGFNTQSELEKMRAQGGIMSQIRPGDRVTIVNRFGQKSTGRAVMFGPGGWVLNMGGKHGTPGIANEENIVKVHKKSASDEEAATTVAALLTADFDDDTDATSTKSATARRKREDELNKFGSRRKMADVPLTEESIWDAITEDFGEAPQVEVPGEGSSDNSGSTDSLPEAMTSDEPEETKAVTETEIDNAEPKSERPKSKMFGKGDDQKKEEPKAEEPKEEKKEESKTASWMNEYDIDQAVQVLGSDPVLGPAARFLSAFRDEVDSHSDGWAYWRLPSAAAAQLQTLLQQGMNARGQSHGVTVEDLKKAMSPIKAFMTRKGLAAGMQMPKLAVRKKADSAVPDVAEAKSEVVSPDTVDADIKQPTESVEQAAKEASNPAAASRKRKEQHPEEFCGKKECLYRTKEEFCPKHTLKKASEHKHKCPDCGETLRCNNPKDCPGEGKPATCGAHENPKPEGMKKGCEEIDAMCGDKTANDVSGDISEAKAEVENPDSIDSDIHQPTESVEQAAKVATWFDWEEQSNAGRATIQRIERAMPEVLQEYGVDDVYEAVYNVTGHLRNLEEIGSSDVSIWVNSVLRDLGHTPKQASKIAMAEESINAILHKYQDFGALDSEPLYVVDSIYEAAKNGGKFPQHILTGHNPFELYESVPGWEKASAEIVAAAKALWNSLMDKNKVASPVRSDEPPADIYEFCPICNKSTEDDLVHFDEEGNPRVEYVAEMEAAVDTWLAQQRSADDAYANDLADTERLIEEDMKAGPDEEYMDRQAAAGDENDEEVEMSLGEGDLADLAANLPSQTKEAAMKTALYTDRNFKTKKQLAEAVAAGKQIMVYSPGGMGNPPANGEVSVEGPHYPEPHRWYARVTLQNGIIVKVK